MRADKLHAIHIPEAAWSARDPMKIQISIQLLTRQTRYFDKGGVTSALRSSSPVRALAMHRACISAAKPATVQNNYRAILASARPDLVHYVCRRGHHGLLYLTHAAINKPGTNKSDSRANAELSKTITELTKRIEILMLRDRENDFPTDYTSTTALDVLLRLAARL
ncbi:hypothetical protein ACJ73_06236 [Blastomyces percursus]|uniref:Uncharacterized protein n=1 Tax=Blastomyces percursus TaxID=1658174 RepID=A0A1J9R1R1_9EURO|nr:hypothetical protein ACJ73_06236 [Blastomyces percursus]